MVLVLRIYSCYLQEEQIFKSSKRGRPWDVYGTQLRDVPGDQMMERSGDVRGTSAIYVF